MDTLHYLLPVSFFSKLQHIIESTMKLKFLKTEYSIFNIHNLEILLRKNVMKYFGLCHNDE